ncbi:hypothetical protein Cyagr_0275 [Cyanobium gracile PCC 6307]|uniref:Uncharacterized protein n=1 Tax=Cyanobium gracile (strain ATCC 27147 / PCC 6307) TaxID=292564 RepID=K9P432_CYAGP|nr:hypothetical protein Cyagr_0275 [Cyanobium gracile PCC 6307]
MNSSRSPIMTSFITALCFYSLTATRRVLALKSATALPLSLLTYVIIVQFILSSRPAKAYEEQRETRCWSLVGNRKQVDEVCTYKLVSWTGGGVIRLFVSNGQKHDIAFGLQGRGENPCPATNYSLNGACGREYFRDPATAAKLSSAQGRSILNQGRRVMICIAARSQSICYGC